MGVFIAGPLYGERYPSVLATQFVTFVLALLYLSFDRLFGPGFPSRLPFGGNLAVYLGLQVCAHLLMELTSLTAGLPWEAHLRQHKALWPLVSSALLRAIRIADGVWFHVFGVQSLKDACEVAHL